MTQCLSWRSLLIVEIGKQCTDTEFTFLADESC